MTDPGKGKPGLVEVGIILDLVPLNLNDLRLLKDRIFMGNFVISVICTDSMIIPTHKHAPTYTFLLNARISMGNFWTDPVKAKPGFFEVGWHYIRLGSIQFK